MCDQHRRFCFGLVAIASAGFFAGSAALAQAPTAEGGWRENGTSAAGAPSQATSGDFGIMQIATLDADALVASWLKPGEGAYLTTAHEMPRNAPITTFVVFYGCKAKPDGDCDVAATFEVIDPSGKPYARQDGPVWRHAPAPNHQLQLSEGALGLVIENKDPLGPYRVRTTVVDRVAGITLSTEQTLTAVTNLTPPKR